MALVKFQLELIHSRLDFGRMFKLQSWGLRITLPRMLVKGEFELSIVVMMYQAFKQTYKAHLSCESVRKRRKCKSKKEVLHEQ